MESGIFYIYIYSDMDKISDKYECFLQNSKILHFFDRKFQSFFIALSAFIHYNISHNPFALLEFLTNKKEVPYGRTTRY